MTLLPPVKDRSDAPTKEKGKSPTYRQAIRVWGALACFTRPEFKVERVSYPWITPGAARGILEAILWRPEIYWEIRQIRVLKPILYAYFRRNEIGRKLSFRQDHLFTDQVREQRNTVALKEVDYQIEADLGLTAQGRRNGADLRVYRAMFNRRLAKGQCFHRPYLGCREFSAFVDKPAGDATPVPASIDHGLMLYDIHYAASGAHRPLFFDAHLVEGVVRVPPRRSILKGAL